MNVERKYCSCAPPLNSTPSAPHPASANWSIASGSRSRRATGTESAGSRGRGGRAAGRQPSWRQDQVRGRAALRGPAEQIVQNPWHQQPEDPRDIDPAERTDQRSGIEGRIEKGHLYEDADQVNGDASHVPAAIAPVRVGERRYVVAGACETVVIDQIDGAPGREHREQAQNEGFERLQKAMPAGQGQECRNANHRNDV